MHPTLVRWSISEDFENAIRHADAAQGQISRSNSLCKGDNIGLYLPMIETEPTAQTPETCDHLIGDEQNLILVTNLTNPRKVVVLWNHKTTCALNRFCDKGGYRVWTFPQNRLFQFVRGGAPLTDGGAIGYVSIWVR